MKAEFKAIAMRCNQEQFDAIKPRLIKGGVIIGSMSPNFSKCNYLINNGMHTKCVIGNCMEKYADGGFLGDHRSVFHVWNEEIFLKACGIETEEKQVDPIFIERYNITDKVKELLAECKKQGFTLNIDNGLIILKQI